MRPIDLFEKLRQRFDVPQLPPGLVAGLYARLYAAPVRRRVVAVIKYWVDKFFVDFSKDSNLYAALLRFIRGKGLLCSVILIKKIR